MNSKVKNPSWIGWAVGLSVFIFVLTSIQYVTDKLGLPVFIRYDEPVIVEHRYYDDERSGHMTALGFWQLYLSGLAGFWLGKSAIAKSLTNWIEPLDWMQQKYIVMALTLYALLMTAAWEIFGRQLMKWSGIVSFALEGAVIALCWYIFYKRLYRRACLGMGYPTERGTGQPTRRPLAK